MHRLPPPVRHFWDLEAGSDDNEERNSNRMLVRAVGQKHNKVSRLRIAPDPTVDPEREKLELMKLTAKKSKKKADDPDGLGGGRKRRNSRRGADADVMWSDDDDDRPGMYGGSEEDDDERSGSRGSPRKMKRKAPDEKGEDYQADDFVVPDESEDDGFGGGRSRKRVKETSEMEEDALDRLEANLEQQVQDKKRSDKKPSGPVGKGKKKKRDDEDETLQGLSKCVVPRPVLRILANCRCHPFQYIVWFDALSYASFHLQSHGTSLSSWVSALGLG